MRMRMRGYKPEIFTDVKTGTLPSDALKLFIGLLSVSDDYGVSEHCIYSYRAKIFPFSTQSAEEIIKPHFDLILERGLARFFNYQGKEYLFINNFRKHQNVNRYLSPLITGWILGDTPESFIERIESVSANEPFTEHSVNTHCHVSDNAVNAHCRNRNRNRNRKEDIYQDINIEEESEVKISIPLRDGTDFNITQKMIDQMAKDYPSVNVYQTLIKIRNWNLAREVRARKSRRGILQHIFRWLGKEQEDGAKVLQLREVRQYARNQKPILSAAQRLALEQLNEYPSTKRQI